MSAAVEIQGLCKRFGTFTAVDHISFSVDRGEILGFLGPNGAGKSTTMKMVTGFLAPTAGRVSICGFDVATQPLETKRRIGYLPEGAPLYGDMTPLGMLRFVAEVRGIPAAQRAARIDDAIARVQLAEVLEVPIETLSKGFKQRVGFAQALLHDPAVLVLEQIGQLPHGWHPPDGYPDTARAWANTGGLLARWNQAFVLTDGALNWHDRSLATLLKKKVGRFKTAGELVGRLGLAVFGEALSPEQAAPYVDFASDGQGADAIIEKGLVGAKMGTTAGLMLCSPLFMWR